MIELRLLEEKPFMMKSNKIETERQRKSERRKTEQIKADNKKKLEEEEKLVAEREELHTELDMNMDIGEEKEQDEFLPPSLTKYEFKIKYKEKEVNLVVDCIWHENMNTGWKGGSHALFERLLGQRLAGASALFIPMSCPSITLLLRLMDQHAVTRGSLAGVFPPQPGE